VGEEEKGRRGGEEKKRRREEEKGRRGEFCAPRIARRDVSAELGGPNERRVRRLGVEEGSGRRRSLETDASVKEPIARPMKSKSPMLSRSAGSFALAGALIRLF